MFGLGRRLWGGSLGSLQNIQSFGKIKTFVSCEKKLEIFCYEILFRENLDMFSKNLFVNTSHTFYQTKSKVFAKHQNVLLKSTKIFLQNSRIVAKVNGSFVPKVYIHLEEPTRESPKALSPNPKAVSPEALNPKILSPKPKR